MVYQLPIPAYQIAAEVDEIKSEHLLSCLLYTSDAADEDSPV